VYVYGYKPYTKKCGKYYSYSPHFMRQLDINT